MPETIPLPPAATEPDPPAFPMVAALAPVGVAAVLYALTRSPSMLLFAVFGPVLAIAAVVDGRVTARRRRRAFDVAAAVWSTRAWLGPVSSDAASRRR